MSRDSTEHLVRMANSIGDFFVAMPDPQEVDDGIAGHIRKFWEPRMRRQLFAHVDHGGEGLAPAVLRSLRAHREALLPSPPDEVPPPTGG
jgi:formate dehydrogenase subunit delta